MEFEKENQINYIIYKVERLEKMLKKLSEKLDDIEKKLY